MNALTAHPTFGVAVTVLAYVVGGWVHRRARWLPTLVATCGLLIALLVVGGVPLCDYQVGGGLVSFFLGPATIALGVPFYKQAGRIRRHAWAALAAVVAGAAAGVGVAAAGARAVGGSDAVVRALLPKGVTTPIAVELAKQVGGEPALTAVFTVLGGLFGSVVGPWVLRRCGVRGDLAAGLAIGTSSHGIGTARAVRESELQGGASGLAMALCGVVTSVILSGVAAWLRR